MSGPRRRAERGAIDHGDAGARTQRISERTGEREPDGAPPGDTTS